MARARAQRPEYKKNITRTLKLTIEADMETLDRLATFLLFAQPPMEISTVEGVAADLPWPLGDAGAPDPTSYPPDDVLRVEITKRFRYYVELHGVELAKNMLNEYGATRASLIEGAQLHRFYDDLVTSTPRYKPAELEILP